MSSSSDRVGSAAEAVVMLIPNVSSAFVPEVCGPFRNAAALSF
jgi:hypothetical protein